jgi:hypothetical protein
MRDGAGVVREHLSSLWRVGWVRGHRVMSAMLPSRREPPSGLDQRSAKFPKVRGTSGGHLAVSWVERPG